MNYYSFLSVLMVLLFTNMIGVEAQNTIGTLTYDAEASLGGYHLIYPSRQSTVFLLDECGQIINRWDDEDEGARPGGVAYLTPEGNLLRAKSYTPLFEGSTFGAGGSGGIVQLVSWDNEVLWTYVVANDIERQHHDVYYMPNGNVLILAYERFYTDDIVANGFDTLTYPQRRLWSEKILEVDPITDSIVWEWHLWDHLVQEHDPEALNYGRVAEHPERVNVNYQEFSFTRDDWVHANSIDYNEALDQIMISARNFNEIWVIDHSTSTEEAISSNGGNSGRGGDLLWRWGAPHAYDQAELSAQKLFFNHDAQWIDDFVDPDYEYYGAVLVFNNFINYEVEDGRSRGQVIQPAYDSASLSYELQDSVFLPVEFSATFSHPDTVKNFSSSASSIQVMGDGHVVMCAARQGRSFELNPAGEVVWEYLTPMFNGQPFTQGFELEISENFTFQVERYPYDYSAFADRNLTPQGYIELEPNEDFCSIVATEEFGKEEVSLAVFPNPSLGQFTVNLDPFLVGEILSVWDARGVLLLQQPLRSSMSSLDLSGYPAGVYFLKILGEVGVYKLVLE